MNTIHQIVSRSGGAYTHDDVFMLESGFVKHLQLMFYEEDCYHERAASIQRRDIENQKTAQ